MVLTITVQEFMQMKAAAMDNEGEEALRLIKEFIKRLKKQAGQGLKSHLDG